VEGISGNSGGRGVQVTCGQMMKKKKKKKNGRGLQKAKRRNLKNHFLDKNTNIYIILFLLNRFVLGQLKTTLTSSSFAHM
jgi:hypothetical protein